MENMSNEYVTLEQLTSLLSETGYICMGHGIGRSGNSTEVVNSIFDNGLRTKDNSLYFTTIVLSTPTPELKQQDAEMGIPEPTIDRLKEQLNNWPHLDSKKIIIARIPTKYINQMGDHSDLDGEMYGAFCTRKQEYNGKETSYLDSKFIIGCFDVEKQMVRLNKNFENELTSQTITKLNQGYKEALIKSKTRLQSLLPMIRRPIIENQQNVVTNPSNDKYSESFDPNEEIEWEDMIM